MARVLLIDSNEAHGRELACALERQQYSVKLCQAKRDVINELQRDDAGFDVLILNLSDDLTEDWKLLNRVCCLTTINARTLMILCLARTYQGPRMRLEAERRGARLVYE